MIAEEDRGAPPSVMTDTPVKVMIDETSPPRLALDHLARREVGDEEDAPSLDNADPLYTPLLRENESFRTRNQASRT